MMFWNFFTAWVRVQWAKFYGYKVIATPWVQDRREGLCMTCDFQKDGECTKCGCLILSKTLLNTEACPVGRWKRIWVIDNTPPNQ
jgi:hypothetical protein